MPTPIKIKMNSTSLLSESKAKTKKTPRQIFLSSLMKHTAGGCRR